MKKIAKSRPDGHVEITTMSSNVEKAFAFADVTADEIHALIQSKGHTLVTDDDIPQDRTFRDAWKIDGGKIGVDMDKARAIHKKRILNARDKADEVQKVNEQTWSAEIVLANARMETASAGDKAALKKHRDAAIAKLEEIKAERDRLAALDDVDLSGAQTPDQLKAIDPV